LPSSRLRHSFNLYHLGGKAIRQRPGNLLRQRKGYQMTSAINQRQKYLMPRCINVETKARDRVATTAGFEPSFGLRFSGISGANGTNICGGLSHLEADYSAADRNSSMLPSRVAVGIRCGGDNGERQRLSRYPFIHKTHTHQGGSLPGYRPPAPGHG
jgi:hypothetical protein